MRMPVLALSASCAVGGWQTVRAERPATRTELQAWPVSARDPAMRGALLSAGFAAVDRAPYKGELELTVERASGELLATLRSDGFFVDQVRGDPAGIARALSESRRVAEFVRNSGTVQQRAMPGQ